MKPVIQKVVIGGVVIDDGKALIVQRASNEDFFPNHWELPGGKKEPLETIIKTVERELKEETGLDVSVIKPLNTLNYTWESESEIKDATQINFLTKLTGEPNVKLSDEHQNFAWIKPNEVDNYDLSLEMKEAGKEAFATNYGGEI